MANSQLDMSAPFSAMRRAKDALERALEVGPRSDDPLNLAYVCHQLDLVATNTAEAWEVLDGAYQDARCATSEAAELPDAAQGVDVKPDDFHKGKRLTRQPWPDVATQAGKGGAA